jgi:4-diphosphocytidyl-2-C-methyl-D-erythritol kinase
MDLLAPAKINLFLHVTGKRADGYHNLFSLMCCIGIYDKITLTFGAKETSVSCSADNVPEDDTNLTYRAADIFFKTLLKRQGDSPQNVNIIINKQIPVAAGLGGGSSNAAAVLSGLNRYYGLPFSQGKLISMGSSIGADVPFLIFQKPALASGIGDQLVPFEGLEPLYIVVIFPGFSVSTKEVYKNLNLGLTKCKKKHKQRLFKKKGFNVAHNLCNDLEAVTASMCPVVLETKAALLDLGASGALMTGSGPTVYGLFPDFNKARNAYRNLVQNKNWRVFLSEMIV